MAYLMLNYYIDKCAWKCYNNFILFFSPQEKLLKSEAAKTVTTPLPSNRKAFGLVNKKIATPAVGPQEKKLLKPQVEQTGKI